MATSNLRTIVPSSYPSQFFGNATLTGANYNATAALAATMFSVTFVLSNPASATLQINAGAVKPLVNPYGIPLPAGGIVAGNTLTVVDSGSAYVVPNLSQYSLLDILAVAGGTADALTATFVPAITTLVNLSPVMVRASSANVTPTPTFTPNSVSIPPQIIVKGANQPLTAGDIAGAGHILELQNDTAINRWVLQNPATGVNPLLRQNSQSGIYTLVLDDANRHILHPSIDTTARTYTIPANASVPFAIGTLIYFVNQNAAGALSIAITTDIMRLAGAGTVGTRTLAANGIAQALKLTATEWIISGTGLT